MSPTIRLPYLPYKYGTTKWDEYLRSLSTSITDVGEAQTATLRKSTEIIASCIADLRIELNWGFSLLHDQMDAQRRQLEEIAERLREISETLKTPTLTLAREAFTLGRQHIRQGLFVKGLEQLTRAEELYDVDFLLQLQIGKVLLYGRNQVEDVLDLDAAEKHLLLAERYARAATIDLKDKVDHFVNDACYHLAVLKYRRSSDQFRARERRLARRLLSEAIGHLETISAPAEHHRFFEARCHCLLGETEVACEILTGMCDIDRRFALVAGKEPDFTAIMEFVHKLPTLLRSNPRRHTARAFTTRDAALAAIEEARNADLHGVVLPVLSELHNSLMASDALLDYGEIDTPTLTQHAQNTLKAALKCHDRAYDEQLTRLQRKVGELNSTIVRSESPFHEMAFLGLLVWIALIVGPLVALPFGILGQFDKSDSWRRWWWTWGTATLLTTSLVVLCLQLKYLRNLRGSNLIDAEVFRIQGTIKALQNSKEFLKHSETQPINNE
jgi:hypothetical protein